jgi:hypothetical protein
MSTGGVDQREISEICSVIFEIIGNLSEILSKTV